MKKSFTYKKVFKNKKGQGLIEYLILVALIAVGTVGVVRVVGQNVSRQYENMNRAMGAPTSEKLEAVNADQSTWKKKDLSDFMDQAR